MGTKKSLGRILTGVCTLLYLFAGINSTRAQEVYANQLTDSTSDFFNGYRVVDTNRTNYAYISNVLSLLSNSYLRVRFPVSGKAGDVVNVTVQGTGQTLGVGLLNSITIRLYDSTGTVVAVSSGTNDLDLALLTGDSVYNIRYVTSPTDTFKFKEARIELNNFLNVNVLEEFRVYNVYYQVPCPPVFANSVYAFGTNLLLTGYVTDAGNAVDNNPNNYATLVSPLNLLNLLPPAYLDLQFPEPAKSGNFVGFTVEQATTLLNLGLLDDIQVRVYDEAGTQREVKSNFNLLNLRLIEGTTSRYALGFTTQTGNYKISRVRIQLNAVLGLLQNIRIYNAFHYQLERPPVQVMFSRSPIMCAGDSIVLTAENIAGASGYMWNTSATSKSITVTQSGTYYVTVMDSFGCSRRSLDINVVVNPLPVPVIAGDTVLCGKNLGTLRTTVNYAGYIWSGNSTADTLNISTPATYTVNVTDANGCKASDAVTVINNTLNISSAITPTGCNNTANGQISLNVTGGSSSYSYRWSDGSTDTMLSNLKAGIYTVSVSDNVQGCTYNKAYTVAASNTLSIKSAVVNTSACGAADGSVAITVVGGSGSYSYSWSNAATTKDISGVSAGIYTVTATDNTLGCQAKYTVVVSDGGSSLAVSPAITSSTSCASPNGSVSLSVSGGSGNYTYQWENNATTSNRTGLTAGTYYVLVKDTVSACAYAGAVEVGNNAVLSISGNVTASPCGRNKGAIALSVSGGSGNYGYSWSDGSTGATRQNLQPGVYYVTVNDIISGCTGKKIFTVGTSGPAITLNVIQPSCSSNDNGAITINDTGAYVYNWSNNSTTKNQSNLKPGIYIVVVTDTVNNCSATYQATLVEYKQIQLQASPVSNTACESKANGAINVTVTGGTSPYSYAWSGNGTTKDLQNLEAGIYTLNVSDVNSCTNSISAEVKTDSSKLLNIAIDTVQPASCNAIANASVSATVTGGVPPYSYEWSNSDTTLDIKDILSGTYVLTVTDSIGCTATRSVVVGIDSNNRLMPVVDSVIASSCAASNDGGIYVTTSGGKKPYSFMWSDNSVTEDITNRNAGSYTLTVTDSLGCTAQVTATVPVDTNGVITIILDSVVNATCASSTDGALYVSVAGGTSPYTYLWSNSATSQDISNVPAGSYTLTVTDDKGCTGQLSTILNVDTANRLIVSVTAVTDAKCAGTPTGSADVDVQGGKLPYTYSWSNGAATQDLSQVPAGSYTLTVTDGAGCTAQLGVNIGIDTANRLNVTVDSVWQIGCTDPNSGRIYVSVSGGLSPYTYLWSDGNTAEDRINIPGGNYSLDVTDFYGCKDSVMVTVSDAALIVSDADVKNASCYGYNDGSITITISGGRSLDYEWSNGAASPAISGLAAGTYTVHIKDDEYNCAINDTFEITQPDSLVAVFNNTNDDCFEMPNGRVSVTVSGGTAPYNYTWSDNSNTGNELTGLEKGTYAVTVTDANGCALSTSTELKRDSCSFDIVIYNVITPNGDGVNDTWLIDGLQYYPSSVVYIFNKWGDMLYEKKGYDGRWNGVNNKGELLPDGTYYYLLKLNEVNKAGGKNEFTGFLHIQR